MSESTGGGIVTLSLHNRHVNPVSVFWLNERGEEVQQHILGPGEAYDQQSYQGDTWLCRDAVSQDEIWRLVAKEDAQVKIHTERAKRNVRNNGLPGIDVSHRPESDDNQFALAFDGDNDIIIVPDRIVGTDLGDEWTIEAWVNRQKSGVLHPIVDKTDGQNGGYFMRIGANDRLQGGIQQNGQLIFGESQNTVPAGQWVHLAVAFDAGRYRVNCYVNGQPSNTSLQLAGPQAIERPIARFNGRQYFELPNANLGRSDAFTLEAWVNPTAPPAPPPRKQYSGTSLTFDGSATTTRVQGHDRFGQITSQLTVEYWFRGDRLEFPIHYSEWGMVISTSGGKHRISSQSFSNEVDVGAKATDGEWHHVAFTWYKDYAFTSYLDGEVQGRELAAASDIKMQHSGTDYFGFDIGKGKLRGQMAQLRIWQVARSEQEIRAAMHQSLSGRETGLVSYLPMNEGSGDVLLDWVSHKTSSVRKGAWQVGEIKRPALLLRGQDSVKIPAGVFEGIDKHLTIECWFRGTAFQSAVLIKSNEQSSNRNLISLGRPASLDTSSSQYNLELPDRVNDGLWHHVALTYEAARPSERPGYIYQGKVKLHLDGQEVASQDVKSTTYDLTHSHYAGSELFLGSFRGESQFIQGELAEVRIWKTTRTAEELQAYQNAQLLGDEEGLAGYWRLDDGTGDTVRDYSRNGRHGRLLGRPSWITYRELQPIPGAAVWCNFDGQHDHGLLLRREGSVMRAVFRLAGREVVASNHSLPSGQWTHLAAVWQAGQQFRLYVNGILSGQADSQAIKDKIEVAGRLRLGHNPTNQQGYDGQLALVHLWQKPLAEEEISRNRWRTWPADTPGLAANWPLADSPGQERPNTTAHDLSGHDHHLSAARQAIKALPAGEKGRLLVNHYEAINFSSAFTLESWLRFDQAISETVNVVEKGDSYQLRVVKSGPGPNAPPAVSFTVKTSLAGKPALKFVKDSYVSLPTFHLDLNQGLTIEALFKLDNLAFNAARILYLGDAQHLTTLELTAERDRIILRAIKQEGGSQKSTTAYCNVSTTLGWIQVVVTISYQGIACWINGQKAQVRQEGVRLAEVLPASWMTDNNRMGVDGRNLYWMNGRIATMRLWQRSLTEQELSDYHQGRSLNPAGLIADWYMNEGSGSMIAGNNAHAYGILQNVNWDKVDDNCPLRRTIEVRSSNASLLGQGWVHAAAVFDASRREMHLYLYNHANGQTHSATISDSAVLKLATNNDPLIIGAAGGPAAVKMTDLRLWSAFRYWEIGQERYRQSSELSGNPNLAGAWLAGADWWRNQNPQGLPALPAAGFSRYSGEEFSVRAPNTFTVSLWCQITNRDFGFASLIHFSGSGTGDWTLLGFAGQKNYQGQNRGEVLTYASGNGFTFPADWPLNSWHHLIFSVGQQNVIIYLDGKEVGRHQRPADRKVEHIYFEKQRSEWAFRYLQIDDLRLWPGELSPADVARKVNTYFSPTADSEALVSLLAPPSRSAIRLMVEDDFDLLLLNETTPRWGKTTALPTLPETLTVAPSAAPLRIAASTNAFFQGMLDSVRLWNVARTPGQIAGDWNRQNTAQNKGLRAYYLFDEGKDDLVEDNTAARNHGRFQGNPAWQIVDGTNLPGGEDNQFVLSFDGQDDAILIPNPADTGLGLTGAWTVEAWIYRHSQGKIHPIVDKTDGDRGGYFLRVGANDRLQGGIRKGATLVYVESEAKIEPMRWVHVAVAFDPDQYNGRLYLNGNPAPASLRQTLDEHYFSTVGDLSSGRHYAYDWPLLTNGQALTAELWLKPASFSSAPAVNELRDGLAFNGQTDSIELPGGFFDELTEGFTVECWYRGPTFQSLLRVSTLNGDLFAIGAAGKFTVRIADQYSRYPLAEVAIPASVTDGQWHHLAFVSQLQGKDYRTHELTLYVDGKAAGNHSIGFSQKYVAPFTFHTERNPVYIGSKEGSSDFLKGQLSELRIWGQARSQANINSQMNSSLQGNEAGLIGYWPLNEDQGNTANDKTANKRHGRFKGFPQWFDSKQRGGAGAGLLAEVSKERDFGLLLRTEPKSEAGKEKSDERPKGQVAFRVHGQEIVTPANAISPDIWQHVAGIWQAGKQFRLYVNGSLVTEQDAQAPANPLTIGEGLRLGFNPAAQSGYHGELSSVRLWDSALEQNTLNERRGRILPEGTAGLLASWRLDDPWLDGGFLPKAEIMDSSGNGHHLNPHLTHARSLDAGGRLGFLSARLKEPLGDTFTIETWFKADSGLAKEQTLFKVAGWQLVILTDPTMTGNQPTLAMVTTSATNQRHYLLAENFPLLGEGWIHVAAVHGRLPAQAYNPTLKTEDRGSSQVEIEFRNDYSKKVTVLWVDGLGIETKYATLAPKATYRVGTYPGHAWRFKDESGRVVTEYVVSPNHTTFAIREQQCSKVWLYLTRQGEGKTAVFSREFPVDVAPNGSRSDLIIGHDRGGAADLRLSEIRLWREARHPNILARFRYHQYSAVNPAHPKLAGLWLSGNNSPEDRSLAASHATGPAELLAKGFADEYNLKQSGPASPWRNTRSSFSLLPATLYTTKTNVPLKIGASLPDNNKRYLGNEDNTSFHGLIDAVRIWSLARPAEAINRFWNQRLTGTEEGLRAYFRFDEGKGELVRDSGPYGNHGAFGGANDVSDVRIWNIARPAADIRADMEQTLSKRDGLLVNWVLPEINQAPPEDEVAQTKGIPLDKDFTLEMRLNVRTLNLAGRYHAVLHRGDDWALNVVADKTELYAGFYFNYDGREAEEPWQSLVATDSPITRKEWVHLAVVGDRKNGKLSLYVDGVEQARPMTDLSGTVYAFPPAAPGKASPIRVGGEGKPAWWKSNLLIMDGLEFDGRNDFIRLPAIEEDWRNGLTIEAWVYYDSFKNWSRIIDLGNGENQDNIYLANEAETNNLIFTVYRDGEVKELRVENALELGHWQHLAAVITVSKDDKGQPQGLRATLYKNGEAIGETADFFLPSTLARQSNYLGRSNWAGDGFLHGRLDEVRIWRTGRPAGDIRAYLRRFVSRSHKELVALWSFEEGSGNAAYDSSNNGYHALLGDGKQSAYPRWLNLSEHRNAGLELDGVDDFVTFPKEAEFDFPGHFTIECWVKIPAWSKPWQTIVSKGDTSWRIHRYAESNQIAFSTNGLSNEDLISKTEIADGRWHHIAAVYNRRHKYLYIDGQVDTLVAVSGRLNLNDYPVVLGDNAERAGRNLQGQVDELRIWRVARKAPEIAANLHARLDPASTGAEGLIGYWPMNENFGSILYDKSGHDRHGELGGGQEERMPGWIEASPLQFQGFHFDGRGDHLLIENSDSLNLTSDFTLSAWVHPSHFGGMQTLVSKVSDLFEVQYALSLEGVQLRFDYARDGNNFSLVGGALREGWNHVAVIVKSNEVNVEQPYLRPTDPAEVKDKRVIVYSGPNYTGRSQELAVGDYLAAQLNLGDGGIQSIRLPRGLNVLVYELDGHDNSGRWQRVTADEPALIPPGSSEAVPPFRSIRVVAEQLVSEQRANQPKIYLYVNGLLVHQGQAPAATRPSPADLWIGGWGGASIKPDQHHFFHGRLDVVCLWNKALKQEELQEAMHQRLDPVPDSVAGLWYLDEEEAFDATGLPDQSQYGNDGRHRYFRPAEPDPTQLLRPALVFDGKANYIDISATPLPADGQPYTVEGWFKAAAVREMALLTWGDAAGPAASLHLLADGRLRHAGLDSSPIPDLAGRWHHAAAVWDGRRRYLYIDGSLAASDTPAANGNAPSAGNSPTTGRLGAAGDSLHFEGQLADIRIWQRARDRAEIKADLNRLLLGSEPGLVGYWRLNEGRDNLVTNLAAAHLPSYQPQTIQGPVQWAAESGLPAYTILEADPEMDALAFDGSSSFVEIPHHADFDAGSAFTIECWLKVNRFDKPWQAIITKGVCSWRLHRYQETGRLSFGTTGLENEELPGRKPIDDGRWHHVAAVYQKKQITNPDGTVATIHEKRLYLDGILDGLATLTDDSAHMGLNEYPVMLGENAQSPGRHFNGLLGEVRLWNRALEQTEVRYNLRHSLLGQEDGLLAYWHFGEQAGTEVMDFSGRGHHGRLHGPAGWQENSAIPLDPPPTCLYFDGKDAHLISDDELALPPGSFTFELWLRPAAASPHALASFGDGAVVVGFQADHTALFSFGDERPLTLAVEQQPGRWLHLAFAYNHAEQRRSIYASRLNENGLVETQATMDRETVAMPAIAGKLIVGGLAGQLAAFEGHLADLRLWRVARNWEEIRANLGRRLRGKEKGLLAYWPLDENRLPYVRDYGFEGYHALRQGATITNLQGLAFRSGTALKLPPNFQQMARAHQLALQASLGILPNQEAYPVGNIGDLLQVETEPVATIDLAPAAELETTDGHERGEQIGRDQDLAREERIVREEGLGRAITFVPPAAIAFTPAAAVSGDSLFLNPPRLEQPYRAVVANLLQAIADDSNNQPQKEAVLAFRQAILDGSFPSESVRRAAAEAAQQATLTLTGNLLGELNIFADGLLMNLPEITIHQPQVIGIMAILGGATIEGVAVEVEIHLLGPDHYKAVLRFLGDLPLSRLFSAATFGRLDLPSLVLARPEITISKGPAAGDGGLALQATAVVLDGVETQITANATKAGQEVQYQLHLEIESATLSQFSDDLPDAGDMNLADAAIEPAYLDISYGPLQQQPRPGQAEAAEPAEPAEIPEIAPGIKDPDALAQAALGEGNAPAEPADETPYHQLAVGGTLVLGQKRAGLQAHFVKIAAANPGEPGGLDYSLSVYLDSDEPGQGFVLNEYIDDLPTFGQLDLSTAIVDKARLDIVKDSLDPALPGTTFSLSLDGEVSSVFSGKTITLDTDFKRHVEPGAAPPRRGRRSAHDSEFRIHLTGGKRPEDGTVAFSDVFDDFPAVGDLDVSTFEVEEFDILIWKKAIVAGGGRQAGPTTSDIRCSFDGKVLFDGQYRLTLDSDFIKYHDGPPGQGTDSLDFSVILRLDERGGGPRSIPFNTVVADMPAVGNVDLATANEGQSVSVSDFEIAIKKTTIKQQRGKGTAATPGQNYLALSFDGKIEDLFEDHAFSLNADFVKYTEPGTAGGTAGRSKGIDYLDFTIRLALERRTADAARAGLGLDKIFDDFPEFGSLTAGNFSFDDFEIVLRRNSMTGPAKGTKPQPKETQTQLSLDGKASLKIGERTFQVDIDTDFAKQSHIGPKNRSTEALDMKVQLQLAEGSFSFGDIFPDFPAYENIDLAAATISKPTILIHRNAATTAKAAQPGDVVDAAKPDSTKPAKPNPNATYTLLSLDGDISLFGLQFHLDSDFIDYNVSKGKKGSYELDYTIAITPPGVASPWAARTVEEFAAPAAAGAAPAVSFSQVMSDAPDMGKLNLGILDITGFYLRFNKNSMSKKKPAGAATPTPPPTPPATSTPAAATPAKQAPQNTAVQLDIGGLVVIEGQTFRLDGTFNKEATQKGATPTRSATSYSLRLALVGEIGFNALVDDVDAYANFDLTKFGVTNPSIFFSKAAEQAKSTTSQQTILAIQSEAITLAGVVASLDLRYVKDSQTKSTGGATRAQAAYQITVVLKEAVNFTNLIEALPAVENLDFETLELKKDTRLVLTRVKETAATGSTGPGQAKTNLLITGPVGTTLGDMHLTATYVKVAAGAGRTAPSEYVIEVKSEEEIQLGQLFADLGLDDNPFGESLSTMRGLQPYFRISNKPGSLQASATQPAS